jgi:signal recognition particle subunit SEC65
MKKYTPTAARVSEAVAKMGLEKHNSDKENPGYRCTQWVEDEYHNPTVKVEWFMGANPDVGLGRKYEGRIAAARREKHREIKEALSEIGYAVVWGWDPDSGEPDTNFIVVISPESAELDAQAEQESGMEGVTPEFAEVDEIAHVERLQTMTISLKEASDTALAVHRAYNVGRDEVARRLEHQLQKAVLMAIVYGTDEAVDLAAAALSTQHLPFAR